MIETAGVSPAQLVSAHIEKDTLLPHRKGEPEDMLTLIGLTHGTIIYVPRVGSDVPLASASTVTLEHTKGGDLLIVCD